MVTVRPPSSHGPASAERTDHPPSTSRPDPHGTGRPTGARSIDDILAEARGRLVRLAPADAYEEFSRGHGLLVDIRPQALRAAEGEVPGSLIIERNVLEWRFDPAGQARLPQATGYDLRVIVLCSEGYTSSLAAASLHDLGLRRATDVVGGYRAWLAAGLPTTGAPWPAAPDPTYH